MIDLLLECLEQLGFAIGLIALIGGAPYLIFGGNIFSIGDARNDRGGMPG